MNLNDFRIVFMLLALVLFLGIWGWAWSSRRRADFDEAARLPFLDDESGRLANGEKR
jgi:cytochrome c oxidase cbb3-type subunit IV